MAVAGISASTNALNPGAAAVDPVAGPAKIKFDFNLPEAKTFSTSTSITVNDGIETDLKEKGSGMQRAFVSTIIY